MKAIFLGLILISLTANARSLTNEIYHTQTFDANGTSTETFQQGKISNTFNSDGSQVYQYGQNTVTIENPANYVPQVQPENLYVPSRPFKSTRSTLELKTPSVWDED